MGNATNAVTHNKARTSIYELWVNMKQRCTNPNNPRYKEYGGRGIKLNNKWMRFEGFYEDMGDIPLKDYTLDRIDNNGNYTQENCRWVHKSIQNNNKQQNVYVLFNNKVMRLNEVSELLGISGNTIRARYRSGKYQRVNQYGELI